MITIKKEGKFKRFFKRFGSYIAVGALAFALIITGIVVGVTAGGEQQISPVNTERLIFALPMNNPTVIKDFSDTELQENATLNQWEAHLSVDISSADNLVYSVLDGIVKNVSYNYMDGYAITITHADGFESVYSSLDENILVKEGDKVAKGQNIGIAAASASSELNEGQHLHFTLKRNNQKVDPNLYIELQNK